MRISSRSCSPKASGAGPLALGRPGHRCWHSLESPRALCVLQRPRRGQGMRVQARKLPPSPPLLHAGLLGLLELVQDEAPCLLYLRTGCSIPPNCSSPDDWLLGLDGSRSTKRPWIDGGLGSGLCRSYGINDRALGLGKVCRRYGHDRVVQQRVEGLPKRVGADDHGEGLGKGCRGRLFEGRE